MHRSSKLSRFHGIARVHGRRGVQRRCAKTELDSLATALYVKTDDLLKDAPQCPVVSP
jgi:hypothetical protein